MMNPDSIVPNWNLIQQTHQVQSHEDDDSSHVHLQNHQNHCHLLSMADSRMRELIWVNGEPTESGFGGMSHSQGGYYNMRENSGIDTLESIVDQAIKSNVEHQSSMGSRKWGEWVQNNPDAGLLSMKKRLKSSEKYQSCSIGHNDLECNNREEVAEGSTCDTTTTMIMESIHTGKTTEEDSPTCHAASENQDNGNQRKEEATRSQQTRSSRAADTHKQSERKRRDRINQKMKALQKLVPNACKTDKASMLDEVIEYMKQLKAQINLMVSSRSVHDQMIMMMMMMPSLGIPQQLQMSSFLAHMATSNATTLHPHQSFNPFIHYPGIMNSQAVLPPPITEPPRIRSGAASANSVPHNEHYYTRFLAQQRMKMELYNNMRALCTQQPAETSKHASNDDANSVQRQLL